jgi:hypothetical protein
MLSRTGFLSSGGDSSFRIRLWTGEEERWGILGKLFKPPDGEISRFRFRGVNEAMRAGGVEALNLVVGVMVSLLTVGVIGSFLKFKRSGVVDAVDITWQAVGAFGFGTIGTGSSARGRITDGTD